MKLLKLTSVNEQKSYSSKNGNTRVYSFLCLETPEDVDKYREVDARIKSKQAIGFWMGFKSQKFHGDPIAYLVHEVRDNSIANVLSVYMNIKGSETTIQDYCRKSDHIINSTHSRMFEYAINGRMPRINESGGYCAIDNFDEYDEVIDINDLQMCNWMLYKDIDMVFEITSNTIVIENEDYVPERLIKTFEEFTNINKDQLQILKGFKLKTILFKDTDYIEFFNNGIILHDLKNIVFETTGQDTTQISGLKKILEYLMRMHPDRKLNIYVKTWEKARPLFATEAKNINIKFII